MADIDASAFAAEAEEEPLNGSWVAELEDAREALSRAVALDKPISDKHGGSDNSSNNNDQDANGELLMLEMHLRVCRAHAMLRQWDRLSASSKKGLALCSSAYASSNSNSTSSSSSTGRYERAFRAHRKRAKAELSVKSVVTEVGIAESRQQANRTTIEDRIAKGVTYDQSDTSASGGTTFQDQIRRMAVVEGLAPDVFVEDGSIFANTNMFQDACLQGDVRFVEAVAALGAALDRPFRKAMGNGHGATNDKIVLPASSTALLMACVALAVGDSESTHPSWLLAKRSAPSNPKTLEGVKECAMRLVHLGADLSRTLKLNLVNSSAPYSPCFRLPELDGKTPLQIAAMSKRRDLVALILEHVRLSPQERALIVHCRCGSRLPWQSTGIGQPPHYITKSNKKIHYRVSPLARCPCGVVPKTYYRCCWRDNAFPTYLDDATGFHYGSYVNASRPTVERMKWSVDFDDAAQASFVEAHNRAKDLVRDCAARFRTSERHFQEFCGVVGPKSNMTKWDRTVYAECVDRLADPFLWRDVHWDVDRAELLRRTKEWNSALERYCDDSDLVGEERDQVLQIHAADPRGPCGCANCPNVEAKVREFQRCARCKRIAYCGRSCQKRDWADHRLVCQEATAFEPVVVASSSKEEEDAD